MNILSLSVGGVSIASIIAMVFYMVRSFAKNRKQIQVTKESIEQAFKDAVLPKTIKLDVSSKIQTPIKEGLAEIEATINEDLTKLREGQQYILEILTLFTHFSKLSEEERNKILEYIEKQTSEEVSL